MRALAWTAILVVVAGCPPDMSRPRPGDAARTELPRDLRPVDHQQPLDGDSSPTDQKPGSPDQNQCVPVSPAADLLPEVQRHPAAIAVDGDGVYWANTDYYNNADGGCDGRVMAWSKSSKTAVELAATQVNVDAIAVDSSKVYWVTSHGTDGAVRARAKDGSGSVTDLETQQAMPVALALQGNALYWVNRGYGATKGSLMRRAGSTTTPLCSDQEQPTSIAISPDGARLFWTVKPSASASKYVVRACALSSGCDSCGKTLPLSPELLEPRGLVAEADAVYVVDLGSEQQSDGAIWRIPLAAAATKAVVVAKDQPRPIRFALDGDQIYWTTSRGELDAGVGGTIRTGTKLGENQAGAVLASGEDHPFAVALDSCYLYWTTESASGRIRRLSR